jgi:hypothetical protein
MGKFDKNTKCAYCETDMNPKYRSKRFCSDKCRVYFNREKSKEVNTLPKTIQSDDPREGTMAFFNKYGVLYKKDMIN